MIKTLLYGERYSIEGARKRIRELRKDGELKSFKKEVTQPARDEVVTAGSEACEGTGARAEAAFADSDHQALCPLARIRRHFY